MNAANLLDGVLSDDPQAAILIQVPLAFVVANDDISSGGGFFAQPRPAIAGDHTSFVSVVFFIDRFMHRLR
ncbi:hypothetical protein D9M73_284600 [compost metagenome]